MRLAALTVALACLPGAASASGLVDKARKKLAAGTLAPETDLAPLVAALERTGSQGEAEALIDGIESLGDADGSSPAAVKAYLRKHAPRALLAVARKPFGWALRGDALMALRTLDADEPALREGIAIARADRSPQRGYLHSRADLLESWLQSRPGRAAPALPQPQDPSLERKALAFLAQRRVRVSADGLAQAAMAAQTDVVAALLDAGLPAGGSGSAALRPLAAAAGAGCLQGAPDLDERLRTVALLAERGADLEAPDALGNTTLMQTVQLCPLALVRKLVELGADPKPKPNAQGFTPLAMAFVSGKWDVAEFLVERGARLRPGQADELFFEAPADAAQRALIKRAQSR